VCAVELLNVLLSWKEERDERGKTLREERGKKEPREKREARERQERGMIEASATLFVVVGHRVELGELP
jgi:hypothetical protein